MVLIPFGLMAIGDLANRIASFASAGVKDGVSVNGRSWNFRLSCILDLSPARRIDCGVH